MQISTVAHRSRTVTSLIVDALVDENEVMIKVHRNNVLIVIRWRVAWLQKFGVIESIGEFAAILWPIRCLGGGLVIWFVDERQAASCSRVLVTARDLVVYSIPALTSDSRCGAFSFRKFCSTTRSILQISAVAFPPFLHLFAAPVRSLTAANGDSTMSVVRRCFQCAAGKL